MLCDVVPVFYLTKFATDTAHVHSKQNYRLKVAFDIYNSGTTAIELYF